MKAFSLCLCLLLTQTACIFGVSSVDPITPDATEDETGNNDANNDNNSNNIPEMCGGVPLPQGNHCCGGNVVESEDQCCAGSPISSDSKCCAGTAISVEECCVKEEDCGCEGGTSPIPIEGLDLDGAKKLFVLPDTSSDASRKESMVIFTVDIARRANQASSTTIQAKRVNVSDPENASSVQEWTLPASITSADIKPYDQGYLMVLHGAYADSTSTRVFYIDAQTLTRDSQNLPGSENIPSTGLVVNDFIVPGRRDAASVTLDVAMGFVLVSIKYKLSPDPTFPSDRFYTYMYRPQGKKVISQDYSEKSVGMQERDDTPHVSYSSSKTSDFEQVVLFHPPTNTIGDPSPGEAVGPNFFLAQYVDPGADMGIVASGPNNGRASVRGDTSILQPAKAIQTEQIRWDVYGFSNRVGVYVEGPTLYKERMEVGVAKDIVPLFDAPRSQNILSFDAIEHTVDDVVLTWLEGDTNGSTLWTQMEGALTQQVQVSLEVPYRRVHALSVEDRVALVARGMNRLDLYLVRPGQEGAVEVECAP